MITAKQNLRSEGTQTSCRDFFFNYKIAQILQGKLCSKSNLLAGKLGRLEKWECPRVSPPSKVLNLERHITQLEARPCNQKLKTGTAVGGGAEQGEVSRSPRRWINRSLGDVTALYTSMCCGLCNGSCDMYGSCKSFTAQVLQGKG